MHSRNRMNWWPGEIRKTHAIIVLILAILIILSSGILFIPIDVHKLIIPKWLDKLADIILSASVSALVIDLLISNVQKKDSEIKLKKDVISALSLSGDDPSGAPMMYSLYNKEAIREIMRNTIVSYCGNPSLADGISSFIRSCHNSLKKNDDYKVKVCRGKGKYEYMISQDFSSTFYFDRSKCASIEMCFVFKQFDDIVGSGEELDSKLHDKSYVFREELPNKQFIEECIDCFKGNRCDNEKLCDLLNLTLTLKGPNSIEQVLKPDEFHFVLLTNSDKKLGINAAVRLKKKKVTDFLRADNGGQYSFFKDLGYRTLSLNLKLSYPADKNGGVFYAAYTKPTVNPRFSIEFDKVGISSSDVPHMAFLSFDRELSESDDGNDGRIVSTAYSFSFSSKRMILPRSGIAFSWNFKN